MTQSGDWNVTETLRNEMVHRGALLRCLAEGPKTIPELAEALGHPTRDVMYWVMGLRRYGAVVESQEATNAGYYRYRLALGVRP